MKRKVPSNSGEQKARKNLLRAKRVVVKVGTRVLVGDSGQPEAKRLQELVASLAALHRSGKEIVLVTSGAIGSGMHVLGLKKRPQALADLQMAAAVGQSALMGRYERLFAKQNISVGQVLLTYDDIRSSRRRQNARQAMFSLLREKVISIVNENDVVAVDEIKFGDNDVLAAMVTKLIDADTLVLMSTTDGLRSTRGADRMVRVPYLSAITKKELRLVFQDKNELSVGGMRSKLLSAKTALQAGAAVAIIDGRRPTELRRLLSGNDVGTLISTPKKPRSKTSQQKRRNK